jgi:hypothetical protein
MKGIQDTSSQTLRQLLGNGLRYTIPRFQRDYSWTLEQWDDLWQDMEAVRRGDETAHYLGYLVLQTADDKEYTVIDGQQRMITLSLVILAVIKALRDLSEAGVEPEANQTRITAFRNAYIGTLNPVSLVADNKLTLNRNNDEFYRQQLVPLHQLPVRGLNASERLLRNCFNWFYDRIRATFPDGAALAEYLDGMVDRLFFTVIRVDDELNAFKVFETLNARGVQLSSADLLKNYLFSIVDANGSDRREMAEMESLWNRVISKLGSQKFPEFLRIYWNSRNKTVRKRDLFKAIRRNVTGKAAAFQLVRDLERSADVYIALREPTDETWKERPEVRRRLEDLQVFQVRQPLSLLMAAYDELPPDQFLRVLRAMVVISFRYNVIGGRNPNDQETVYNGVARTLREGQPFTEGMLADVYPADESFKTELTTAEFRRTTRGHKLVRYILGKIERQEYQADFDYSSDLYTVEYVLPESPGPGWNHIEDTVLDRFVYRLGNLAIMERGLNKEADNLGYAYKKPILARSQVNLTADIPDHYAEWDERTIDRRQRKLASVATGIWRLNI